MENIYYDLRLDIQKDIVIDSGLRFTQGDSKTIYLRIVVTNGGQAFNAADTTPSICFVKPDGNYVVGTPTESGGYWTYQILGNELQAVGKVLCDMKFTYGSGRVSSSKFTFMVERDTTISGASASSSYIAPMQELLNEMTNYRNQGSSMAQAAETSAIQAKQYADEAKSYAPAGYDALVAKVNTIDGKVVNLDSSGEIDDTHVKHGTSTVSDKIDSIEDDIEDINDTLDDKADKSTTLAGYGITNAYTKTETDNLISPITTKLSDNADWLKSKNLYSVEQIERGYIYIGGAKSSAAAWGIAHIPVDGLSKISISGITKILEVGSQIAWEDSNKSLISIQGFTVNSNNISVPSNAKYIGISLVIKNPDTYYGDIETLQVEEGEVATSYVPYAKSNVAITNELANINNNFKILQFWYSNYEVSMALPSGFTHGNSAIVSAMAFNQSNSSWALIPLTNTNIRFNADDTVFYYNGSMTDCHVRLMICKTL